MKSIRRMLVRGPSVLLSLVCTAFIISNHSPKFERRLQSFLLSDSALLQSDHHAAAAPVLTKMKYEQYSGVSLVYWRPVLNDLAPDIPRPGDLGAPIHVPKHLKNQVDREYSRHGINLIASNMVAKNRTLKDSRSEACTSKTYPGLLPTVSVIIVSNNEAPSTLARTVISVVRRTPENILKEIIVVDDKSSQEDSILGLQTIQSISTKVQIISLRSRAGLIRARLHGAEAASSAVLVFFDAHVEVATGWVEPLLDQIVSDRTSLVVPVIHTIDPNTFKFEDVDSDRDRSGFDQKLYHTWISREPIAVADDDTTKPFPTPTILGCAFAIDREFFFAVGSYDKEMEIWGGENVEQSIRTWLCGGQVVVAPCSHVGHLFRSTSPHTFPEGRQETVRNTARLGAVLLEEYFDFIKLMSPSMKGKELVENLEPRMALKKRLRCRDFDWFLEHVYPDAPLPFQDRYTGPIQLHETDHCLQGNFIANIIKSSLLMKLSPNSHDLRRVIQALSTSKRSIIL